MNDMIFFPFGYRGRTNEIPVKRDVNIRSGFSLPNAKERDIA